MRKRPAVQAGDRGTCQGESRVDSGRGLAREGRGLVLEGAGPDARGAGGGGATTLLKGAVLRGCHLGPRHTDGFSFFTRLTCS